MIRWGNKTISKKKTYSGKMKLKSCPFCGCTAIVKSFDMYGDKWFYVMCPACRAEINEPVQSEKEAAQAWNRRVKHIW